MGIVRSLQRLGRLMLVLNPAACLILLTEGKGRARAYLSHIWWTFATRKSLPVFTTSPLLLPRARVEEIFEGIDISHIEMLYPMPRPGGVSVEELIIICAIVRMLNPKLIVEIGTCEGRTALNMAYHSPEDAQLITLDLPPDLLPQSPERTVESGPDYRQMGMPRPGTLFENHPLKRKIKLVLADSTKFDWTPYDGLVDLVFIDGAHDFVSVMKDSENALRIVKSGGVILWHDYGVVEGVTAALNGLGKRYPIKHISGTSIACLRT